jgi:hypothetical protein
MKIFHLLHKQTHIAATTFDFKDIEDNSILFMRIYKSSPWHDAWAKMEEGDKFGLDQLIKLQSNISYPHRPDIAANTIIEEIKSYQFAPEGSTSETVNSIIDEIGKLKVVEFKDHVSSIPDSQGDDIINQYDIKPTRNEGL